MALSAKVHLDNRLSLEEIHGWWSARLALPEHGASSGGA
jgi:hypothetical protein